MVSALTNQSAQVIVDDDTNSLITLANNIVHQCIGRHCNVSYITRREITEQLSLLAQKLAQLRLKELAVPRTAIVGRSIYNNYLNLSSEVASTYNYQCGDIVPTSFSCVNAGSAVISAKNGLITALTPAINKVSQTVIVTSILWFAFFIFLFLFFICLLLGFLWSFIQKSEKDQKSEYISDLRSRNSRNVPSIDDTLIENQSIDLPL